LTCYLASLATIRRSFLTGIHVSTFHHERVEREQWSDVREPSMSPKSTRLDQLSVYSWTLITSSFSQRDLGHLLFNGFSYYFTVPIILSALGNTGFLALYLGAGLAASASSLWWHSSVKKNPRFSSLGASGASRNSASAKNNTLSLHNQVPCTASCRSSLVWSLELPSSYLESSPARLGCVSRAYLSGTGTALSPEVDKVRTPLVTLEVFWVGSGITSSGLGCAYKQQFSRSHPTNVTSNP